MSQASETIDRVTSTEHLPTNAFQQPRPKSWADWVVTEPSHESAARKRAADACPRRRSWLIRRTLAAADVTGLTIAFVIGQLFIAENPTAVDRVGLLQETLVFVATLPVWVLLARSYGLYDRDEEQANYSSVDDSWGVLNMVTLGTWILVAGTWLTHVAEPNFRKLFAFWLSAIVLVSCGRILARALVRRTTAYVQNTLIIGAGSVGQLIARKLLQHPEYGLNIVGFVDDNPTERRSDIGDLAVIGSMTNIALCVELLDVERVIVAFSGDSHETTLETIRELETLDVQIDLVPRLFEGIPPESHFHSAEGLTLIALPRARLSYTSLLLKRSLDVVGSLAGLVLLSPLLIAVGIAIRLDSRGPILFRQTRDGPEWRHVRDRQVPHDGGGRGRTEARGRPSEQAPPPRR